MISVENFYWILYQNLLGPVGLDCWYHTPFGTNQNLNKHEYQPRISRRNHHVMFYHDQEPIWSDDFGPYDLQEAAWHSLTCRLLANSEKSSIKKQVCQQRGMIDWYFFYHGFAALDWYRDAEYLKSDVAIQRPFLLLNHLMRDHRAYRMALVARLIHKNVAHLGCLSVHGTWTDFEKEVDSEHNFLSLHDRLLIKDCAPQLQSLPWIIDTACANGNLSAQFGHRELSLWQKSLFHVVTETVFYEPKKHLTEKIFKPIISQRPFFLVAAPGNLAYLKSYGFKTFAPWVDESYDDVEDHDKRLNMISAEICRISTLSMSDLFQIQQEMLPILAHNKRHFFGDFRQIIVDEMVNNFDSCLRQWNNGRVDGRELQVLPDIDSVKNLLKS